MELKTLKDEIAKQEYDGMSDQQIADAINAKMVQVTKPIPTWKVKQHAIERGYWAKIQLVTANTSLPDQVRGLAISARDWIDDVSGKVQTLDTSRSSVLTMLGAMVSTTLMTQQDADDLIALASESVSWTSANGLSEVGPGLIVSARRWN